jgi:hypothetical protein
MSFADIVDAIPNFYEILEDGGHLIFYRWRAVIAAAINLSIFT